VTGPAGQLAAGRHQRRQIARVGPRQAAGASQPPRGPCLRRVAAGPGEAGDSPRSRLCARRVRRPHSSSRCATTSTTAPRPDRRRRGGRGSTGQAAARARYPGGPAISRRPRQRRHETGCSRAWMGDSAT
jgi:hypothetical protein